MGARVGPSASGELPQRNYNLDAAPRGIRKAGFRGVMGVRQCKRKAGYPPSAATDAMAVDIFRYV